MTCPMFGAQNTPLPIRVLISAAISVAISFAVRPAFATVPESLYDLSAAVCREAFAGVLIGTFISLSMQGIEIAGGIMDLQTGLASSKVMNPLNGIQSTVISQMKSMLAVVIFLTANGHQLMIEALVKSYGVVPSVGAVEVSFLQLMQELMMIGLRIAAPVMAVGFLVDATLGLLSRAIPQMQVMQVGLSGKIGVGIAMVAITLPMTVAGVYAAVGASMQALKPLFHL